MTQENEEQKPIEETTGDEANAVDPHEAELSTYKDLMIKCFGVANEVLQEVEGINIGAGPDLALTFFNRCTREMPEQVEIATKGLEFITTLMDEKTEQANFPPFVPFVEPIPPCKHPQLARLRDLLVSKPGHTYSTLGESVLAALTIDDDREWLRCPACGERVALKEFKDGSIFSEPEGDKDNEC